MKQQIKKWTFRLAVTALFIVGLLLVIILNPGITYANNTTHNNYTVFHNQPLDKTLPSALDQATALLQASEFYNPILRLDICLNDGSNYPLLIKKIRGEAFAWGFYNKVVLQGAANYKENHIGLNGYNWNFTQLLAHEMTHCLQFDELGFWKSNPVARIPNWKWEGYAEYIARQNKEQKDLYLNIARLLAADKKDNRSWAIQFEDHTIAPREYYRYWILMQYCLDIKRMSYRQVLKDRIPEEILRQEMMHWYNRQL